MSKYVIHATCGTVPQVHDNSIVMAAAAARAIANDGKVAVIRTSFKTGTPVVSVERDGEGYACAGNARYRDRIAELLAEHG